MIELQNVTKDYGLTRALDDVSFSVNRGEIIGFVGPNGAGKTTAMKIITTYSMPTSGKITVGGYDVVENPFEVRKLIGYLPETVPLYDDMLVDEYLSFVGEARHLNGTFKKRREWVIDACGLEPVIYRKIGVLSKGYKQRTCLAQALIHDPDVLILDEPTSGLDPLQIIGIRNLIKELAKKKTIILSTHILPEVTTIADRILVINKGKIVGNGSFEELRESVTKYSIIFLKVKGKKNLVDSSLKQIKQIQKIEYSDDSSKDTVSCKLYYETGADIIHDLNKMIRDEKLEIESLYQDKLSLEESFIKLTALGKSTEDLTEQGGIK
ncbi:ATP-binding cassette domain-containing protein [bacterium]|nr:ATP-binding cassette domain-containing protein [bacterium]